MPEIAPPAAEPRACNHAWGMIGAVEDRFYRPCMTPGCNARQWVTVQVRYVLDVEE